MTGASSGIGAACARFFAREGAAVVLGARSVKTVESIAAEIRKSGGRADAFGLDVRDEASVRAFARAVRERHRAVDLLLNNAGVGLGGGLLSVSVEDFDETMATNVRGAFLVLKEVVPLMLDGPRPRTVFNVASVVGTMAVPNLLAYVTSKWAVRGMSQAAALDVGARGVRVVSVNPGYVATPMVDDAPYPAEDMMQPDEVAETLVRIATLPEGVQVDDLTLYPRKLYTE